MFAFVDPFPLDVADGNANRPNTFSPSSASSACTFLTEGLAQTRAASGFLRTSGLCLVDERASVTRKPFAGQSQRCKAFSQGEETSQLLWAAVELPRARGAVSKACRRLDGRRANGTSSHR
jgi:hypothetical protein